MEVASALLAGFVGAMIGLLIALIGQSREDDRLRRSEDWRQQTAKQERLRAEFATALRLIYAIEAGTEVDPGIARVEVNRLGDFDALYRDAHLADIRMRLEGATVAWQAVKEVAHQFQVFSRARGRLQAGEGLKGQALSEAFSEMRTAHLAIVAVSGSIHQKLALYLEAMTPPGQPPPSGLRMWLRHNGGWLRR